MNKISKIILSVFSAAFLFVGGLINIANADTNYDKIQGYESTDPAVTAVDSASAIRTESGMSGANLPTVVGNIIKIILGLTGTIALIFIIWGGVKWMISKGDSSKIADARKLMVAGVIGLAIIAAAYAISDFVIKQISSVAK